MISLGGAVLVFYSIFKTILNEHSLYAVSWPATWNRVQRRKQYGKVMGFGVELGGSDILLSSTSYYPLCIS